MYELIEHKCKMSRTFVVPLAQAQQKFEQMRALVGNSVVVHFNSTATNIARGREPKKRGGLGLPVLQFVCELEQLRHAMGEREGRVGRSGKRRQPRAAARSSLSSGLEAQQL
jgi:hypothetical protein